MYMYMFNFFMFMYLFVYYYLYIFIQDAQEDASWTCIYPSSYDLMINVKQKRYKSKTEMKSR